MYSIPAIHLYENVIQNPANDALIGTLDGVTSYRQSYRANLGFYICQILVTDVSDAELIEMFYNLLGLDLKAMSGGLISWEGMIYDLTLHYEGISRTRTFDAMANSVKVTYIDTDGNVATSSAFENATSIATYGKKEDLITMDSFDQTPAETRAQIYVDQNGWPQSQAIGTNFAGENALEIFAMGYGWTLNWKYTTTADDSTTNVPTWIADIVDTDAQFVTKAKIESDSPVTVDQTISSPIRCWDMIETLNEIGDTNNNFYQSYVDEGRRFYYRKIDMTPYYLIQDGEIKHLNGAVVADPWNLRPAVFRDMDYISQPADPGSPFSDTRDFFVEEIEVSTGGVVTLKTAVFDEAELLAAQQEYILREEKNKQAELDNKPGSQGSGEKERLNWKRKIKLGQDDWKKWEKMSQADRWKFRKKKIEEWKAKKKKKG